MSDLTRKPAGAGVAPDHPPLVPAALLPDGTPHPDPFLAERGWQVVRGVYRRVSPERGRSR